VAKDETYTLWRLVPGQNYGIPEEVDNLAAFCREKRLDHQAMRDMLRGKTKQHRGWVAKDPNPIRTQRIKTRADELERLFDQGYELVIE
jgi:hypothetical protein